MAVNKLKRQRLHEYERPLAMLASQQAEINRNRKKRKQPYTMDEFYLYKEKGDIDLPNARYGAAAKKLIQMGKFPSWALFVYKDLISMADETLPPEDLALIAEDCIVLAPTYEDFDCMGMVIALESASGQLRQFQTGDGAFIQMRVPKLDNKANAIEDATLHMLR
jgi:hypothetical protein